MSPQLLEYPTLKALREALEGCAGPAQLFVPGYSEPELGDPAEVVLIAEREELEIPITGVVTWRYPAGRVPPGRVEGVGLLLDAESQALPLYRSVIDGLAPVVPPGGRLPDLLQLSAEGDDFAGNTESISVSLDEAQGSDAPSDFDGATESDFEAEGDLDEESDFDEAHAPLAEDEGFETERTLSSDELDEIDPPAAEDEADEAADDDDEDEDPDEVPTLDQERERPAFETEALDDDFEEAATSSDLTLDTQDLPPEAEAELRGEPVIRPLPENEPWPALPMPVLTGRAWTESPKGVARQLVVLAWPDEGTQRNTWVEAEQARGRSVDEIFASQGQDFDERTDPAQLPDAVNRATTDLVDDAEDTILALPITLWVTRGDGSSATVLFEAGAALPAETTFRMKAAKDALHLEAQILSEQWDAQERDLVGVVRFPLEEAAPRQARARATLSPTGLLEVAVPADEPTRTEHVETGIVPVPLRASAITGERSGLLSTIKRLFKTE